MSMSICVCVCVCVCVQVKELGDRCAAAESQARDAQRLARVHALAAKQAAAASARRTTA